jgi:hypothetical protein
VRGELDAARRTLEDAGEVEGPLGVELARAEADRGDPARALALARRILPAARLEGPVGQPEVLAIQEILCRVAPRVPQAVLGIARNEPPAAAGFVEGPTDLVEAVAAEAARQPAEAAAACERADARGFLSLELLAIHVRALRSLGRDGDAERFATRLRSLAPLAPTDEVPNAFPPGP